MRKIAASTALALLAAMGLAGCGKSDASSASGDGVKTDRGVTDSTITLGVLTDKSGVFKDFGITALHGNQLWLDEVNAAGGVCGRQVKLEIRDHGYKAEVAKVQFPELEPKVVAFVQLLGSAMLGALQQDIRDAKVSALIGSYSSLVLDNPYLVGPGTTYDLDMINALAYLLEQKRIAAGDTVGHVYIEGEFGSNALAGTQFFAERHGLKVRPVKITPTDTDLTNVTTSLRGANVDAIAFSGTPPQAASIAAASKALKLDVPLIANLPAFVPQLMDTPAAAALTELMLVGSSAPYSVDNPRASAIRAAYDAAGFETVPNFAVNLGYAFGSIMQGVLEKACGNGDLTRDGVHRALQQSTSISTGGLTPALDYSIPGAPPARSSYIAVPDATVPGGLRQIEEPFTSADAEAYVAPHQKG